MEDPEVEIGREITRKQHALLLERLKLRAVFSRHLVQLTPRTLDRRVPHARHALKTAEHSLTFRQLDRSWRSVGAKHDLGHMTHAIPSGRPIDEKVGRNLQ